MYVYVYIFDHICIYVYRRKFRSQTSDMDRCSNSCENSQRRERVREEMVSRKKIRDGKSEKRGRRKKIKVREKVKVAKQYVFFQCFVAPEGLGAGSLKRRVRSHLVRRDIKNCTRLWCEAHFEVKMLKAHYCRSTFGSWDVEKVFAAVARSTRMTWRHFFVAGRSTYRRWGGKSQKALVRGRQLHAQLAIFEGRLAELLRFWRCQIQEHREVSQKFSVLELRTSIVIVWGSLAELFRFVHANHHSWRKLLPFR